MRERTEADNEPKPEAGGITEHARRLGFAGIAQCREALGNARKPRPVDLDQIEDDHHRIGPAQ